MSKNYQNWLKYKRDTCSRNINKGKKQYENDEITFEQFSKIEYKYQRPLMDLYDVLSKINNFPWDSDYSTIINHMNVYGNEIVKVDDCLQILRCSLILYDEYKSKSNKEYTLYELMDGIYGHFGEMEDNIFKNIREYIKCNKRLIEKELCELKLNYEYGDDY